MKKVIFILLVSFISFPATAEEKEYILSEDELDDIYYNAAKDVDTEINQYNKKRELGINFDLQIGVISSDYDAGSFGKKQANGFYLQFKFKKYNYSSIFIQIESSSISLDENTIAANISYSGIGGSLGIYTDSVKVLLMLGSSSISKSGNDDSINISSISPVLDFGFLWEIGTKNPSFVVKIFYRNQKLKETLKIDKSETGINSFNSLSYSFGLNYAF